MLPWGEKGVGIYSPYFLTAISGEKENGRGKNHPHLAR
jgi:hypothetical protein